jgi:MFS family permease
MLSLHTLRAPRWYVGSFSAEYSEGTRDTNWFEGSIFGNLLGGVVGNYASWHWIFWILAILAAMVTVAGQCIIPLNKGDSGPTQLKGAVDWIGGTIVTVALLCLLFGLTEGNVVGWTTPWIPVLIVVSVLLLAAFTLWQLYLERKSTRKPLLKVSIFKNIRVAAAMGTMALL